MSTLSVRGDEMFTTPPVRHQYAVVVKGSVHTIVSNPTRAQGIADALGGNVVAVKL